MTGAISKVVGLGLGDHLGWKWLNKTRKGEGLRCLVLYLTECCPRPAAWAPLASSCRRGSGVEEVGLVAQSRLGRRGRAESPG